MAPHSSTLAWKIPWTKEPGGLQSMGSLRVKHDWATSHYFSLSCIGEGNENPLQCSCLENPRDGGTWLAAIYGVSQSRTQLKWLSSSSSSYTYTLRLSCSVEVSWPTNSWKKISDCYFKALSFGGGLLQTSSWYICFKKYNLLWIRNLFLATERIWQIWKYLSFVYSSPRKCSFPWNYS